MNLEAEHFAAKRRSHHPGMRECFFDQQWIFHAVSQRFHFKLHPVWRTVSALLTRYIFQTSAQPPVLSLDKYRANKQTNNGTPFSHILPSPALFTKYISVFCAVCQPTQWHYPTTFLSRPSYSLNCPLCWFVYPLPFYPHLNCRLQEYPSNVCALDSI